MLVEPLPLECQEETSLECFGGLGKTEMQDIQKAEGQEQIPTPNKESRHRKNNSTGCPWCEDMSARQNYRSDLLPRNVTFVDGEWMDFIGGSKMITLRMRSGIALIKPPEKEGE